MVTTNRYTEAKVQAALAAFEGVDLTPAESLVASAQLLHQSLESFRKAAPDFRAEVGEEASRSFATEELNDIIYQLQDSITPLLKTYNSLLRDSGQGSGAPE